MKCDELKSLKNIEIAFNTTTQQEQVIAEDSEGNCYGFDSWEEVYLKSEADKVIAEKDEEIARLKDKCLDVKDAAHVLKAFKFYLCQLTHCAYDELTAQWILDNWEQDYKRVEEYKG